MLVGHVLQLDRLAAGQRMLRTDEQHCLLRADLKIVELPGIDAGGNPGDDEIELERQQSRDQWRAGADIERDVHPIQLLAEILDHVDDEVDARLGDCSNGDSAELTGFVARELIGDLVEIGEHALAATDQDRPIGRRFDAARRALEQGNPRQRLDFGEHLRCSGLGDVQPLGGELQLALIVESDQQAQLAQFQIIDHSPPPSCPARASSVPIKPEQGSRFCFEAFSWRERAATSLENAPGFPRLYRGAS
ncbi:hypothetical protein ACVIST_004822 [Bradyrhizobium elkanii]